MIFTNFEKIKYLPWLKAQNMANNKTADFIFEKNCSVFDSWG